ncbi:MAG: tetratricopeptide repeat protein [Bryobacteraceae bacterium]
MKAVFLRIASLWVIFAFTSVTWGQTPAQIAQAELGRQLMADGKFEQAIPIYRQLSQAVPGNPGLLLNLGMALQLAGHSRQAVAPLESALKIDSTIQPAWLFLGSAYLGLGKPDRAIPLLKKFVHAQPEDTGGRQSLGDAYLAAGDFAAAGPEYQKLTQLEPENPRAWYGLNRCLAALAEASLHSIEQSAPESAWWLALVGDERLVRRQFRSAFFFYRKAESLQPALPGLHASIADVYQESGHPDWADAERKRESHQDCAAKPLACAYTSAKYEDVIRLAGTSPTPEACYWRSKAYSQLARDAFARLEKLREGPEIHELRAGLLRARRQNLESIKEWRRALEFTPHDEHLREELLLSLYQARDYAAALPLADELLRENPASPELNFTKGDILLSSQETEKAMPYLKAALKSNPKLLAAHHALGRAYMQIGQPAAAIPHLQAALPIDEDGSLRYQLTRAYQATGQTELGNKALADYQEYQKSDRAGKTALEEELKITPP